MNRGNVMEAIWKFLSEISGGHIARYGLYIPGEQYTLLLWMDLYAFIATMAAIILFLEYRSMSKTMKMSGDMYDGNLKISPGARNDGPREIFSEDVRGPECVMTADPEPRTLTMVFPRARVHAEIMHAVVFGGEVDILYRDIHGEVTNRVIRPMAVYKYRGIEYLKAFCRKRNDERNFRFDRIIGVQITCVSGEYLIESAGASNK
jgi:hypothetical protein